MSLHGNWLDLLILIFLLLYSLGGIRRGLLTLAAEMATFLLAFIISLRFYHLFSALLISNFSLSPTLASVIGFLFIALFSELVLATLVTALYQHLPAAWFRSSLNHILGFFPALIDGLIIVAFFLTIFLALPVSPQAKAAISHSKISSQLLAQTTRVENSVSQIFGGAINDSLNFLTIKTGSTENINLHFRTTNYTVDQASESDMLRLVNSERISRNLAPLVLDPTLRQLARTHSQDMLARGYFSHVDPDGNTPFDRMRAADIHYEVAGENLAYAPTLAIAHDGLMNSPGHRSNILNPDFGHIGIGVIDAGVYGKMFTQEFTN